MVDLSFIGKDGIIIQYEEIISLIGFNIHKALSKGMSDEDILLGYFNREIEDPSKYIEERCGSHISIDDIYLSKKILKPNCIYAFKFLDAANKNKVNNLAIYSNKYSEVIRDNIKGFFDFNVDYVYGDIVPILKSRPNCTYMTSNTENVKRIHAEDIPPFALTIVDDFAYTEPIVQADFVESLREKGVFVGFTGIISAGITP